MRYSANSEEADRAEAFGGAGSGEYSGHQLSHLEAVDLPRKNQVGENARRAPPRAGERDRPAVSEKAGARRHRDAARKSAEDQRAKPADWARVGDQIQRAAGAGHDGDRGAAYNLDHHGGCGEGGAVETRGAGGGADQIGRSNDTESMTKSLTFDWCLVTGRQTNY